MLNINLYVSRVFLWKSPLVSGVHRHQWNSPRKTGAGCRVVDSAESIGSIGKVSFAQSGDCWLF